jgi:hypothetical protein
MHIPMSAKQGLPDSSAKANRDNKPDVKRHRHQPAHDESARTPDPHFRKGLT